MAIATGMARCAATPDALIGKYAWSGEKFAAAAPLPGCFPNRCAFHCELSEKRHEESSSLHDAISSVKIDKINGELHSESVDGFARHDPQTLAVQEPRASQQALSSPRAAISNLKPVGYFGLTSQIGNAKSNLNGTTPLRQDAA